jgi:hypothetical protein
VLLVSEHSASTAKHSLVRAVAGTRRAGWAEAVEVQAIAADLVAHLLGDLLHRRPQPIQPDVVDSAAARAHHVRVSAGHVRVVAIWPLCGTRARAPRLRPSKCRASCRQWPGSSSGTLTIPDGRAAQRWDARHPPPVRARRRSAAASVHVRARATGPRFHSRGLATTPLCGE